MPRKSMRLDLRGFQRRRSAGAVLVAAAVLASLVAVYFFHREAGIAGYYLEASGHEIPNAAVFQRIVSRSDKPVAVMFESPTCPVCRRMAPYWSELERASDTLPVDFYHIMAGTATIKVFEKYGVDETPTFIVFVGGKPVLRHVGAFVADNVTEAMLSWAEQALALREGVPHTPRGLAERGLQVYERKCASCHGVIRGLSRAELEDWLRNAARTATAGEAALAVPALKGMIEKAVANGSTLAGVYGGWDGLVNAVRSMRRYVDLSSSEVTYVAYMLDYASAVLAGREPPVYPWMKALNVSNAASSGVVVEEGGNASRLDLAAAASSQASTGAVLVGAATALVAGVVSVFSPCVLPLLIAQVSVVARSGRRLGAGSCLACGLAAAAGVVAIGSLFLVAAGLASSLQQVLLPVVAAAIVAAGLASLLGVPVELEGLVSARRGGLLGFCGLYGVLAVQCNLPIVLGVLLLIAGLGMSVGGLAALAALAVGSGVPLAAVMLAASRGGAALAERLLRRNELLTRIGGVVLVASGVYLLLYSLQLV